AFGVAARLAPDDARVLNNLACYLTISGDPTIRDPARAVVFARRAVKLAPDNDWIWHTLGRAYYRAGRWDEATAALEHSRALPPRRLTFDHNRASTWFYLAMAYSRL